MPSSVITSAWPCDSPAVKNLNIRAQFYMKDLRTSAASAWVVEGFCGSGNLHHASAWPDCCAIATSSSLPSDHDRGAGVLAETVRRTQAQSTGLVVGGTGRAWAIVGAMSRDRALGIGVEGRHWPSRRPSAIRVIQSSWWRTTVADRSSITCQCARDR